MRGSDQPFGYVEREGEELRIWHRREDRDTGEPPDRIECAGPLMLETERLVKLACVRMRENEWDEAIRILRKAVATASLRMSEGRRGLQPESEA